MTVAEMRALLGLGAEVSDAAVVDAYAASLDGAATPDLITMERVKQALKIDSDDDDDLLALYLRAAIATLDGPTGWLGRALTPQTITTRFDGFFDLPAALRYPPLIEVLAVEYRSGGAWVPVPFSVDDDRLLLLSGTWPTIAGSGRVIYRAGMDGAAGRTLPAPIEAAILLMVGDLYANRQTVETGVRAAAVAVPMSTTVDILLSPFRLF